MLGTAVLERGMRMTLVRCYGVACAGALAIAGAIWVSLAAAEESSSRVMEGSGVWSPGNFAIEGQGCKRTWTCGPQEGVPHKPEETVIFSADQTTTGTCEERHGKTCGYCAAPEPAAACTWKIEEAA